MRADDAVERRGHMGIPVIDRRDLGVDLRLQQVRLRVVARRGGRIQRGLGNSLPLHQFLLSLEIRLGLSQRCLRAGLRRLRLLELQLVGFGLDREQGRAFLHKGAVLVFDRLQKTLNACNQIDILDRRGVTGRFQIARERPLRRHRDIDFRRRRRNKTILFAGT
jgi:hypothetical protein